MIVTMKGNHMSAQLPPVIRIFISSTFADMGRERKYFNTVIVPQLNRLCAGRGISFFSVDLRWGITQEDQINGNVVPICLREIDNCRPFFIGILGQRYGSILNDMSFSSGSSIPWLKDMLGKSVTEIEMYYGVLQNQSGQGLPDCLFLFQSNELAASASSATEPKDKQLKLKQLKDTIRNNQDIPSFEYNTMEEFGERIISAVSGWLDQKFPSSDSVHEARRKWYNGEILRDYIPLESAESFLDRYCGLSSRSLMIYGHGQSGKTTALSAWQPKNGMKILINCEADDAYQYWPAVANEIVSRINEIDENTGLPEFKAYASMFFMLKDAMKEMEDNSDEPDHSMYYVTDEDRDSFRKGFVSWLKAVRPRIPLYIVINDLNYFTDVEASYLSWLPEKTEDNVHLICSVNDEMIAENAGMLGWNLKEMPLFSYEEAKMFLDRYLGIFGKNMSNAQKENLLKSPLLRYPGYLKFIIQYFNNYGSFENLDELSTRVSTMTSEADLYQFVLDSLLTELSPDEKSAALTALGLLAETSLGLSEDALYTLVKEAVSIDAIGWSKVRLIFEQFQIISADTWKIWDSAFKDVINSAQIDHKQIHHLLGKSFYNQMDDEIAWNAAGIRKNTDFAEAALFHLSSSESWDDLLKMLEDRKVLYYLSKMEWNSVRSAWMRMIIFSDIDVPEKIMAIFEKCDEEYEGIEGIKQILITLMNDLEQWTILDKASEESGLPKMGLLRHLDDENLSEECTVEYNYLVDLKEKRQFQQLLSEVEQFLEKNEANLNDSEKCRFYMMKMDSESQMGNHPAALNTSYQYYKAAVGSMNEYEIMRSLLNRASFLYFEDKYSETLKYVKYTQKFALDLGACREYLSAANVYGMCLYRLQSYDESIAQFKTCIHAWERMNNDREVISCRLNISNAMHLSGDTAGAARELENAYQFIGSLNRSDFNGLAVKVLGNLGILYDELEQRDQAEASFLKAKDLAKRISDVNYNNYMGLISHYEKYRQFSKAIEVYQELCEFLEKRRMYGMLASVIANCLELMHIAQYTHQAREFKEQWRLKFSRIPGGEEFFEQRLSNTEDAFAKERLKEDLLIAKTEGNYKKTGEILLKMADKSDQGNTRDSASLLLEAMDALEKAQNHEKATECACRAVQALINSGFDDARFNSLYETFDDSGKQVIDHWLNLNKSMITDEDYAGEIEWILDHSHQQEQLCGLCLIQELEKIIEKLPPETVIRVAEFLNNGPFLYELRRIISDKLLKGSSDDLAYLKKNYLGKKADAMLAAVENKIALLETMDNSDAGVLAGNVAVIYRRRKEEDQTISHHDKAMRIFKKHGMTRDMFIEKMNLATAYKEFGDTEKMINTLRETLNDPDILSCEDVRASVAGNLAAVLIQADLMDSNDEIISCFEIEETFFRKAGEYRELVISLINQMQYYLALQNNDPSVLQEKYYLAEKIVRQYQLKEFAQIIRKLKPLIIKEEKNEKKGFGFFSRFGNKQPKENVRDLLSSLVPDESDYEIAKTDDETNTAIHALLFLKKDIPLVKTNVHLWIDISGGYTLQYMFIMQPQKLHNRIGILMKQYVDWWNEQDDYELLFDENGGNEVIICKDILRGSWSQIQNTYKRVEKLWMADLLNMSLGAVGVLDLELSQKMKLDMVQKTDN